MNASGTATANRGAADVLALGFGITVAMWGVGYVARLPFVMAPGPVVLLFLLACPLAGGWVAGSRSERGMRLGLGAGAVSGVLNLLVLGSFLSADSPSRLHPTALVFVPGSILIAALLAAGGAYAGARARRADRPAPDWTAVFAKVAVGATFFLVIVGGLVTSNKAGLAVVDWPNSFGYNMFLYPISRMTGGIYYEHAHRLFGSLVGLTTVVLAVHLHRVEDRRWLRRLSLVAVALVIVQGILGGLRVTGKFTLADDPSFTSPNIYLAIAHGVLGQLFFSTMVAIAVFSSRAWKTVGEARTAASAATDRSLTAWLVGCLALQLTFGAIQRHLEVGLTIHIAMACVIALLAVTAGLRAVGLYRDERLLRRAGLVVALAVSIQLCLGLGSFILVTFQSGGVPFGLRVAVTTLHQATGASLLAASVALALWTRRRLLPAGEGVAAPIKSR